jgi:glucokinase
LPANFPEPVLLADAGGTNVRFVAVTRHGGSLSPLVALRTHDFAGFEAAAQEAAGRLGIVPRSVLAAGAGPHVDERTIRLTNAPWRLDGPAILRALGLAEGMLFNDFEALSLALPVLSGADTLLIRPGAAGAGGPRVAFGPGTGLGVAALLDFQGRYVPVKSEGSHVELGPASDEDFALWPHLDREDGRMGAEALLSGRGLERLHAGFRSLALARGEAPGPALAAPAITAAAVAGTDPLAKQAVQAFLRLVGRLAGDMAITFCATGGVTLGGGILPRLAALIPASGLAEAFIAKAPVADYAANIGLSLVLDPDTAAIKGLAALAADPARYLLDYDRRLWSR